jgi:carbamoyltransferase
VKGGRDPHSCAAEGRRDPRADKAYKARTAVPALLNTSFNENEPISCTPLDVDSFVRTKMDVLAMGDFYAEKLGP